MGKVTKSDSQPARKPMSIKQQWDAMKPKRPVRPAGRYATFVGEYSRANEELKGPELFKSSSRAWRRLDNNAKVQFENPDEMAQYKEDMEQYHKILKAMKRPAESYGLFVQHYWLTKKPKFDGGKHQFGRIQKEIAKEWADTPDNVKTAFEAASESLKRIFEQEREAVLAGEKDFNLNWREEGILKVSGILNKETGEPRERRRSPQEEKELKQPGRQLARRGIRSKSTLGNSAAPIVPNVRDDDDMELFEDFDRLLLGNVTEKRQKSRH